MDIRIICVGTGAAGDSAHLRAFVAAFDEDGCKLSGTTTIRACSGASASEAQPGKRR